MLPVEVSGISSRSESVPASSCGGSPSPHLSPSALMTSCAASSVQDRRRVLHGAAASAIVVLLCLRAGDGVRISRVCVWACVRVGTRCSPPAVCGGPVARGVQGPALSHLRLPSSWGLSGPAAHLLWARVCGYGVQRCPHGPYSLCSSGAGSRGFAARMSVVRGVCGRPLPPPPDCLPSGRAVGVRHPLLL